MSFRSVRESLTYLFHLVRERTAPLPLESLVRPTSPETAPSLLPNKARLRHPEGFERFSLVSRRHISPDHRSSLFSFTDLSFTFFPIHRSRSPGPSSSQPPPSSPPAPHPSHFQSLRRIKETLQPRILSSRAFPAGSSLSRIV